MTILVEKPGILTTVQDTGRYGYRRFGINPGGVMDRAAARLLNALLGNDEGDALLEMHFPGPRLMFQAAAIAAIGGADLTPVLDDKPLENWRPFTAKKGSILRFTGKVRGNRAYLAVKGGIDVAEWLGSSSTNLAAGIGGFKGRKLEAGDRLKLKHKVKGLQGLLWKELGPSIVPYYRPFPTVRIVPGAEFEYLDDSGRNLLLNQDLTISNRSDRMGFRLSGKPVELARPTEFISTAVSFGTVQLLPDGQLIILMADHQTAGGYPRIAHVITRDLPLLAQLGANDKVAFHLVSLEDAESLAGEFERELKFLRIGCRFQENSLY